MNHDNHVTHEGRAEPQPDLLPPPEFRVAELQRLSKQANKHRDAYVFEFAARRFGHALYYAIIEANNAKDIQGILGTALMAVAGAAIRNPEWAAEVDHILQLGVIDIVERSREAWIEKYGTDANMPEDFKMPLGGLALDKEAMDEWPSEALAEIRMNWETYTEKAFTQSMALFDSLDELIGFFTKTDKRK